MKVLITGGTGFLGKYLIDEFLEASYDVIGFGRNEEKGKRLTEAGADFCRGDFTNRMDVDEAMKQSVDLVVHAGALSDVWGEWSKFHHTNVWGTQVVVESAIAHKVKRFVYISSPSVYAKPRDQYDIKEDNYDPNNRLNNYIRSKIESESLLKQYENKIQIIILRPRALFGIGDESIIPRLLRANRSIGIPLLHDGSNIQDMTCVENVAHAARCACEADDKACGQIFNVTNGDPQTFKALLERFTELIDEEPRFRNIPYPLAITIVSVVEWVYRILRLKKEPVLTRYTLYLLRYSQTLDMHKAKTMLGYKPIMTVDEGIIKYAEHYKRNKAL